MAVRFDIGTLRPPVRLPNGALRAEGLLTRSGVFTYRNADGTERREYRPPEHVFDSASLRTFELAPVTDDHPPRLLDATTARTYAVGSIGESIRRDGDYVAATLVVIDAATIEKMERGKVALSCGYECDVVAEPGEAPDGERYDAIQTNIRGNHVAIVDVARAGAAARVRMDAADAAMVVTAAVRNDEETNMDEIEKLKAEIAARDARIAELEKALADAKGEPAKDAPPPRVDAAEVQRLVRARVKLETAAAPHLDGADVEKLTDRDLKVAVVKKLSGVALGADSSDDYVAARFDAAIEHAAAASVASGRAREVVEEARADGDDKAGTAYERMIERNRNAWKKGN